MRVSVEGLGKRYRIGQREPYHTLRDAIARATIAQFQRVKSSRSAATETHASSQDSGYVWALRNVSLQVAEGEVVGIIGQNGAGKTTLLKLLSRITEPTEGIARIRGRVGSLLEVGTGFHPELTGRENLYLNGAILGMTKKEVDGKFDQIVEFSGIEKFIDTPVKRYSDGMRVRLGFAVAAHLEPDILIVDEVLAVGDVSFQKKSMGKMGELAGGGRTVLLVSHNMAAIQNLCTHAYALDHGRVFASGDVNDVISQYLESGDRPKAVTLRARTDRRGTGKLQLTNFSIGGATKSTDTVQCGAPTTLEVAYEGTPPLRNVDLQMFFFDQMGVCVLSVTTGVRRGSFPEVPPRGTILCRFEKFPLLPGLYNVTLDCDVSGVSADRIRDAVALHVVGGDYYGSGALPDRGWGYFAVPHEWEIGE